MKRYWEPLAVLWLYKLFSALLLFFALYEIIFHFVVRVHFYRYTDKMGSLVGYMKSKWCLSDQKVSALPCKSGAYNYSQPMKPFGVTVERLGYKMGNILLTPAEQDR